MVYKNKKQLELEIMGSYGVKPLIKPGQKKSRKRIIAQILTIINERKNKIIRQEKR